MRNVFVGLLTPDKYTGPGNWTDEQIVAALKTGHRPDGRVLAPITPWKALASLTQEDGSLEGSTGRFRPTSLRFRSTLSLVRERDAISSLD